LRLLIFKVPGRGICRKQNQSKGKQNAGSSKSAMSQGAGLYLVLIQHSPAR